MEDLKENQITIATWYVDHKKQLYKIAIGLFIIFDLILVIFGAWGFAGYFINLEKDQEILNNWVTIDYEAVRQQFRPKPPQVLETMVVSTGLNKYDLVARIKNQNELWYSPEFSYRFLVDNQLYTAEQNSFFGPEEDKYLVVLSYESVQRVQNFTVAFDKINWKNINKVPIKDAAFLISGEDLEDLSVSGNNQSSLKRLSFEFYNDSIYSFWEAGFQVLIYGSVNKIVSVNYLKINEIMPFEERMVEMNIFDAPSFPRNIEILPDIDIYSESNYRDLEAEPSTEIR